MIPTTDQLEIARIALGLGLALSNVAVWVGVYLERDNAPPETKDKGWRLLVRALAAEAALAFLLLAADTTIGVRQRAEIAALEQRLAARTLDDSQVVRIRAKIHSFASQKFGITTYWAVPETNALAKRIGDAILIPEHWEYIPPTRGETLVSVIAGVVVVVSPDASETTKRAGAELIAALANENIAGAMLPSTGYAPDRLEVEIGIKP